MLPTLVAAVAGSLVVAAEAPRLAPDGKPVADYLCQAPGLRREVLELALGAYHSAQAHGHVARSRLTIVDYERPSYEKRLWVLDVASGKVLYREWVAHGMGRPRGSGGTLQQATSFSNEAGSREPSLGLYRTAETYHGRHGYSLRLDGLEPGINDAARRRAIVIHGAWYVSAAKAKAEQLGRSWGCPVVRREVSRELIDAIEGGSILWIYHPNHDWLERSRFLRRGQPE
jgi:hypothetical protein